jgi:hypothetical protein
VGDVPLQTYAPHGGLPEYPAEAGPQVPSAVAPSDAAQASHAPLQAELQQKPLTHVLLAQSPLPLGQAWPTSSRHCPVELQLLVPLQFEVVPLVTAEQVPGLVALLQAWQVAQLDVSQQTPSTQKPESHWLPVVHAFPCT